MLLSPWPLAFLIGIVLGVIYVAQGKAIDSKDFQLAAGVATIVIDISCLIGAIGIAKIYAKPISKRQKGENNEAPEIPSRYQAHFSSEQESNSVPRSDRQDVTGQLPPSSRRDDGIQELQRTQGGAAYRGVQGR